MTDEEERQKFSELKKQRADYHKVKRKIPMPPQSMFNEEEYEEAWFVNNETDDLLLALIREHGPEGRPDIYPGVKVK